MRMHKPRRASLDEVRITREGETAIIENADGSVSTTHLKIGSQIGSMSDAAILNLFNLLVATQEEMAAEFDNRVIEIPLGRPQISYMESADQWVPRGQVLHCHIDDDENGELVVHIDDQELRLQEFGRLLRTYAGWGMRITFVPDDRLTEEPEVEVREPDANQE
jgi:hypothetical protein